MDNVIYLIESGEPLRLVKHHIAEVQRVHKEVCALLAELGTDRASTDPFTGVLTCVVFPGAVPDGWTKPGRKYGTSHPKKGTAWHKRFQEQVGHPVVSTSIREAFGVPTHISYTTDTGNGFTRIGNSFFPCGFAYPSAEGPFALYVPDVVGHLKEAQAEGKTVTNEDALAWTGKIPGARRIEPEEWDILVATHKLKEKNRG